MAAETPPTPSLPEGFRAGAVHCGLRRTGEPDLGLLLADRPLPAAAVFTRNELVGAHVTLCREQLRRSGGRVQAVLVNAKNANCATGTAGIDDAARVVRTLAARLSCAAEHVLMVSTGVIGARLPVERIEAALPALVDGVRTDGFADFARAIMTTDTFAKVAEASVGAGDGCHVVGCAKGAGMIHPDMATMLAFLLTDARVELAADIVLRGACDRSFHRVTVDGDTSPNDTVLLWTSERRRVPHDAAAGGGAWVEAVLDVSRRLCRMIARDGEGATRLVTVRITGSSSEREAATAARVVATSPLVKTAIYGRDPNWGRILSAAARAGVPIRVEAARVWIGPATVYAEGRPHPEAEAAAHAHLRDDEEVEIGVDLATGPYEAEAWTCDFSPAYVSINADYRT